MGRRIAPGPSDGARREPVQAPRRTRRLHPPPDGGDARTYLEGGIFGLFLSLLTRRAQARRIERSIEAARALDDRDHDDQHPERWSRDRRQARDAVLARRRLLFLLVCAVIGGLYMWLRLIAM